MRERGPSAFFQSVRYVSGRGLPRPSPIVCVLAKSSPVWTQRSERGEQHGSAPEVIGKFAGDAALSRRRCWRSS